MDRDERLSQREQINAQLLHAVDATTTPWGVKVPRIRLKSNTPHTEIAAAKPA